MPFFTALEQEIASSEINGRSVILMMDPNAKLGQQYIKGDPHSQSDNGKLLAEIINRHALCVVNSLEQKAKGLITRVRNTTRGLEQSIIDFVIMSADLIGYVEHITIDDKREHVLTKIIKNKGKVEKTESDHNMIVTELNLPWDVKENETIEIYDFKNSVSQNKFKDNTKIPISYPVFLIEKMTSM